jgi:hypothetical protein
MKFKTQLINHQVKQYAIVYRLFLIFHFFSQIHSKIIVTNFNVVIKYQLILAHLQKGEDGLIMSYFDNFDNEFLNK